MKDEDSTPTLSAKEWAKRADFYSGVGQAISLWASMESALIQIAAKLLGTSEHKTGLVFYSIMNFYTWLSIIDELFSLEPRFASCKSNWTSEGDVLRGLNDIRVRLAHHTVWESEDPTMALRPARFDARAKSKKHAPLTDPEIVKFSNDTLEVGKRWAPTHKQRSQLGGAHTLAYRAKWYRRGQGAWISQV